MLLGKMNRAVPSFLAALALFTPGTRSVGAEVWTLSRALEQAAQANADARLAQQRISAAQAGIDLAESSFWPQLGVQSSYTRTDNPMMTFGNILNQRAFSSSLDFNDVPDVDNLNVKGIATLPLYAGGRLRAGKEAAQANADAAARDQESVLNNVSFEVTRSFYTILKAREFVRAAEASVRAFENSRDLTRKRVEGGTALKTDLLDISVRLAQANEDLVRSRNAQSLSERVLANLLGLEDGEPIEVAEVQPMPAEPKLLDASGRPELAAARERERAAEQGVRGAKSGYYPRLSAFGSLDYDYGWKYDHGGGSYSAGAMAEWSLWDGKATRSRVRLAQSELETAREQARKLRLGVNLELDRARLDLKAASERTVVAEQGVTLAEESAQLTQARYEQGQALASQLIDSETALLAARVRRAEAAADRGIAVAALRKALGLPQLDPVEAR